MTSPQFIDLNPYIASVRSLELLPWTGEVIELVGLLVASRGPAAAVGDFCEVITSPALSLAERVEPVGEVAGDLCHPADLRFQIRRFLFALLVEAANQVLGDFPY